MTIHSDVDYHCPSCRTAYVPMSITPNCPKCGTAAKKLFDDFINDTLDSARYNVIDHRSFLPGIWSISTTGDHYYYIAFGFLNFAYDKLKPDILDLFDRKIPRKKAEETAAKFMEKVDSSEEPYMAAVFKAYFIALISSGDNTPSKE